MRYGTLTIGILIIMVISGCGPSGPITEIKLAHGLSESHAVHKGIVDFANRVYKKSEGRLSISIYPNGILGTESQCIELLQIGSLGMTKVSSAAMESFAPKYKVLGIPYIFNNDRHRDSIYDGAIGKEILNSGLDSGLKGLCFYDAGSRSFYTIDKAIRKASDLKGLKIRVMRSITANKMMTALGASPVPIDFGELFTALQQGVVDGAENNAPSFHLTRHYETSKYYTLDKHTSVPDVLVIGTLVWDRLTEEQKEWIASAAIESLPVQRAYWKASEEESLKAVREAGIEIIVPDLASFQVATRPLLEEFGQNKDLKSLIERIKETGEVID